MNILAVDDEPLMLHVLTELLQNIFPEPNRVWSFDEVEDVFEAEELWRDPPQYAFLDIKLRGMLGIDLAKRVKERSPATRILFCTAYSDYAMEAFKVHAVGYLLKPLNEQKLRDAIKQVEQMLAQPPQPTARLRVQTFGHFEAFANGRPLAWEREKARELLAFLVDRRGASVSNAEIALVLWEDDSKTRNVPTILSSLRKTLHDAGAGDVLIHSRNRTAVDTSKFDCDLYDYLAGDVQAINAYKGEYMSNYSWGEFTNGWLYSGAKPEQG